MNLMSRKRKTFSRNNEVILLFHGSSCKIRTENFDFDRANSNSDFGKAIYFGLDYGQAVNWAKNFKKGVVNWYAFMVDDAFNDPDIQITVIEDRLEWLDTILSFIDGDAVVCSDIIIGDIMDSRTALILRQYQEMSNDMGIKLRDLDIKTKRIMIDELKPDVFHQQIAFKTQKALKHVKFIGSMVVTDTNETKYVDPFEIAATISMIISEEDEIPLNDALINFMQSNTFLDLISKREFRKMDPRDILTLYRSEV